MAIALGDTVFYKFSGTEVLGPNFHTHYGPGAASVIPDTTIPVNIPASGTVAPAVIIEVLGSTYSIAVWAPNRAFFVHGVTVGLGLGQIVLKL